MILFIDNFDSFTFNLVQLVGTSGRAFRVVRNDAIDVEGIARLAPQALVLSPGPGGPADAGVCVEAVRAFAGRVPILGVCLGHQCLAAAFGGRITRAPRPRHGVVSSVTHTGTGLFTALPSPFPVGRYHSLAVDRETLPPRLRIAAISQEDGVVMGLEDLPAGLFGLQFHPESYLTSFGHLLIYNFLDHVDRWNASAADSSAVASR